MRLWLALVCLVLVCGDSADFLHWLALQQTGLCVFLLVYIEKLKFILVPYSLF